MIGPGGSIQLMRVFGIRIGVNPSWFLVLFIFIFWLSGSFRATLNSSDTTAYATAVAAALLFFVSLILHELGHALVAKRNGIDIAGIDLWFFGGVARMSRDTDSPGVEFRVSAAGPLVTLLVVAVCFGIGAILVGPQDFLDSARLQNDAASSPGVLLVSFLASINALVFLFNLIPAFPLDGGRIVRAIAWKVTGDQNRGTRLAARLGQVLAWGLMGLGAYVILRGDTIGGIWFLVLGWFIAQAARGAVVSSRFSERLEGVTVADVMDTQPVTVPGELSVRDAQDEFFLRYRFPWFPVVDGVGRFLGILREESVEGAVNNGHPAITVGEVLGPHPDAGSFVRRDTPIEQLLGSETLRRLGALMVVDAEERLCGVVTIEQVRRALAAAVPGPIADG